MLKIYGLKNCDSCRKALKWLTQAKIPHVFLDIREDGVPQAKLADWLDRLGWETVLNRRSTSWRDLADSQKANMNSTKAHRLATKYPTLIKRPVFDNEAGILMVGFTKQTQTALKTVQ